MYIHVIIRIGKMYTYSTSTRILYDARYRRLRAFIIGHVVNERLACVRVVSRYIAGRDGLLLLLILPLLALLVLEHLIINKGTSMNYSVI